MLGVTLEVMDPRLAAGGSDYFKSLSLPPYRCHRASGLARLTVSQLSRHLSRSETPFRLVDYP